MSNSLVIGFAALLVVLTLFALYVWSTRRGAEVSAAERRVFARFLLGGSELHVFVAVGDTDRIESDSNSDRVRVMRQLYRPAC